MNLYKLAAIKNKKHIISTSNNQKQWEYKRLSPHVEVVKGIDVPEVMSDPLTVAIYKAKGMPKNVATDDSTLKVDGKDIVDIKWLIHTLKNYEGKKAEWNVYLSKNDGNHVKVFKGTTHGYIGKPKVNGIGFDPYVYEKSTNKSLSHLEQLGIKDQISARREALENMLSDNYVKKIPIKDIPEWKGRYQNDELPSN